MKVFILQSLLLLLSRTPASFASPVFSVGDQVNSHGVVKRNAFDVACQTGTSENVDGSGGSGDYSECERGQETILKPTKSYPKPRILSLKVDTTITARYVSTTVVTTMKNRAPVSQDSNFRFRLSDESFISDFFMVVNDQVYQAEVKEKEAAQKAYNEAKSRGQTASQVKQSDTDFTKFETNVNLSPNTTASFHLTFQEHLRRKNGVFRHKINLFPKEIVQELIADVYITEPQGIYFANITWEQDYRLTTDFLYDALSVDYKSDTEVHAHFNPSAVDQEGLSKSGLEGDLVITYDVTHDNSAGQIEIVNGYFVHHISPVNLPPTRKNVVFVIDTSGSMFGSKIRQTQDAMLTIIDEIRDFDRFNIIRFASQPTKWKNSLVNANKENKEKAKQYVESLRASGGTNILDSLMLAVSSLKEWEEGSGIPLMETDHEQDALPMIIFLTDGHGSSESSVIINSVTDAINGEIALFSLAFGTGADYDLLEKLSGHNQGLARQIYADSSASLQLEGFYDEVATPLLHHVSVQYPEDKVEVDSLTKTNFITYFEGTELVIAGKLKENFTGNELSAVVTANSFDVNYEWGLTKEISTFKKTNGGNEVLQPHVVEDFAQRLWAYVTIKDLLSKQKIAMTSEEKTSFKEQALSLAVKYKFVTPLTSLIIVKPDDEKSFDESVGDTQKPVSSRPQPQRPPARAPGQRGPTGPTSSGGSYRGPSYGSSGAAGDPHIIIDDPDTEVRMCFDIHSPYGTVVSLIEDARFGVSVNGEMVGVENVTVLNSTKIPPTFFGRIAVRLDDNWITISREHVLVNGESPLPWVRRLNSHVGSCEIEISDEEVVHITCKNGVSMKIFRHHITEGKYDYFDFFLGRGRILSKRAKGIIGLFHWKQLSLLESSVRRGASGKTEALLLLNGESIKVSHVDRPLTGPCWNTYAKKVFARLKTKYEKYILPHLLAQLS